MRMVLNLFIGLLIVAHLLFFGLEAIFWTDAIARPVRADLKLASADESALARVAMNQGLSNAFLAVGLGWGLWGHRRGRPEGRPVLRFFLAFIAMAGLFGFITVGPGPAGALGFLLGQTGLALAGLWCVNRSSPP